jgi:hypothetical protein
MSTNCLRIIGCCLLEIVEGYWPSSRMRLEGQPVKKQQGHRTPGTGTLLTSPASRAL